MSKTAFVVMPLPPKTTTIMVRNVDLKLKNKFKALCADLDNKPMQQRMIELIQADVQQHERNRNTKTV